MAKVKLKIIEGWKLASKGKKLLVDLTLDGYTFIDGKIYGYGPRAGEKVYRCNEELTDLPTSQIIAMGYRETEGWKDGLAFYRMPVFIRFHNFTKCDFRKGYVDRWGDPTDPKHGVP